MPDIFHVIPDMGVGGAGVFLSRLLADAPKTLGSLVLLPQGSLLCSLLEQKGIPYRTYVGCERSFSLADTRAIGRVLEEKPPQLLVSHASLSARIAAKRLGVSTVSVKHCDAGIPSLSTVLYNAVTDATVATSRHLAIRLRYAGVKNVLMFENGSTDMGVADGTARIAARRRLSLPEDGILIGLSGRLSPVKGHAVALSALAALSEEERSRFLLCFLGVGEEEGRLRALSATLKIQKQVRFLGFLDDVRPFYHAIDAHISCSLESETSSLSLAEGLSAGCPTLASDTPGNRERVGEGGRLFPVGDARALALLFRSLLLEEERASLRARALARARALPSWERTRKDYASLFGAFCGELVTKGCFFGKDMLQ